MRSSLYVFVITTSIALAACGGESGRTPAAPTGIAVSGPSSAVVGGAPATISWSCFTRAAGTGGFGISDCPPLRAPARPLRPATAAPISAPGAPTSFSATVSGSTVTLNWAAPVGGDAPTSYTVQAGSSNGLSDLANFDTGSTSTSLVVLNVPAGTYFVRIRANNSAGQSGPSNEFQVIVGSATPCSTLGAPTGLTSTVIGSTVALSWTAPAGCAPTTYIVQAGSTTGASNLANFSTGTTATIFTATNVGNGTYFVRVLSAVTGVLSAPSNEITVTVPATPTSPIVAGFQFFDPATQASATTICRITQGFGTTCTLRSTSYPLGSAALVNYKWTVQYTYGTDKTIGLDGPNTSFSFTDTCGGPGASADGALVPLTVILTVTDSNGATATVTAGSGSQPALFLKLFNC